MMLATIGAADALSQAALAGHVSRDDAIATLARVMAALVQGSHPASVDDR